LATIQLSKIDNPEAITHSIENFTIRLVPISNYKIQSKPQQSEFSMLFIMLINIL